MPSQPNVLELRNVSKAFPGVRALDNVSFSIGKGEICALLGENGAGKSTLTKIVSGVYPPDAGEFYLHGKLVIINNVAEAQHLGIGTIYQEFNLFPNLTILENIAFSYKLNGFSAKLLNWKEIKTKVVSVLKLMNISLPLNIKVKYLTVANQQIVEIAKALILKVDLLIMDEPTAALSDREIKNLFSVILKLKTKGLSIIYISHRMEEILSIADKVIILRDGKLLCSKPINKLNKKSIVQMITGKRDNLNMLNKKRKTKPFGNIKLEVKGLTYKHYYSDISFKLREAEIFGFLGLLGAGKTEIGTTLFGLLHQDRGEIIMDGKKVNIISPNDALRKKIAYIPEDRKRDGTLTNMSLKNNITISALIQNCRFGVIDKKIQFRVANKYIKALQIKTPTLEQNINFLSGGNQQKALIGRSLAIAPEVLIMDQPTRGLDVGAKGEIRKLLHNLADKGVSIIVLTMEVSEAMELCDTIAVLKRGKITNVVKPTDINKEQLVDMMISR